MKITWDTEVNAPCCAGQIVAEDGRTRLIQTDWDYPGVAGTFGWSVTLVQRCNHCGCTGDCAGSECGKCDETLSAVCDHAGTDGTVDCPCGVTAAAFIESAGEWLAENDGAAVDDPGYFE